MSKEQKVGLFFVGGLVILLVALGLTGQTSLFTENYPIYVDFEDVHGLTSGSEVRVAGIRAGSVAAMSYAQGAVRAELAIDKGVALHESSSVYLDYQALSGTRFVSISLGDPGSPVLKPGSVLEGTAIGGFTGAFEELQKVGASIRKTVESFDQNQDLLLDNLNAMIEENSRALQATLGNLEVITARVAAGEGTLGMLSTDDRLYAEMTEAFENIRLTASHLEVVAARLTEGRGTLGRLLSDTAFYDEARETMARLRSSVSSIDEVVAKVRSGEGTLGRLLTDDSLYHETEDAVRALSRSAETIEDQAPISIMGTAIGTLF